MQSAKCKVQSAKCKESLLDRRYGRIGVRAKSGAQITVYRHISGHVSSVERALNALGESKPEGYDTHHIGRAAPKASFAQAVLRMYGVGSNDAENGLFLPKRFTTYSTKRATRS